MEEEKKMEKTITKKKKAYVAPTMRIEEFVPNEYIGACWYIACEKGITGGQSGYSDVDDKGNGANHTKRADGSGCGHATNQVIQGNLSNFTMTEEGTDGLGTLKCTITSATTQLKDGDVLKWTTSVGSGSDYKLWAHWGYVKLSDQSRPNHS